MLKKFLLALFSLTVILMSTAAAQGKCPTYLDAAKNYILFADLGAQGAGLYIDKHTCGVAEESAKECVILIDEVQVPDAAEGKTRIVNRYVHRYKFDLQKKTAYRYVNEEDKWVKLDPTITNPEDDNFTYDVRIAEMAYYLTYGKKFFGTFDKDFYKSLN